MRLHMASAPPGCDLLPLFIPPLQVDQHLFKLGIMKFNSILPLAAIVTLAACGPTPTDDSFGPASAVPATTVTVTGDDYYAPQINRMIAAHTNRADSETTMLRDRLQDDARAYVVSRKLPAGSGWTYENLMFKRVTDEAGFRAIVKDFYGYPGKYAPIYAKLKQYPSATFIGLSDDTYCMLYFNAAGVLVDGSIL